MAAFLSAQNLPLNLIAPNGGEIWEIGSTQNIFWAQQNLSGSVRLMLLGANSNVGTVIAQNIPVNAGTFTWTNSMLYAFVSKSEFKASATAMFRRFIKRKKTNCYFYTIFTDPISKQSSIQFHDSFVAGKAVLHDIDQSK